MTTSQLCRIRSVIAFFYTLSVLERPAKDSSLIFLMLNLDLRLILLSCVLRIVWVEPMNDFVGDVFLAYGVYSSTV